MNQRTREIRKSAAELFRSGQTPIDVTCTGISRPPETRTGIAASAEIPCKRTSDTLSSRLWCSGNTKASQALNEGSIPFSRFCSKSLGSKLLRNRAFSACVPTNQI